jgi:2'-5' RNA ligase
MFRALVAALEVDFLEEFDAILRDVWEELRADGHPAPDGSSPPHVSLAAGIGVASPEEVRSLESATRASLASAPHDLTIERVNSFPGDERVVYLAPALTPELTHWHADLWRFARLALAEPIGYYTPGKWVPHCTMRWGPGPPVEETVAWLRERVDLPMVAPFGGVAELRGAPGRTGRNVREGAGDDWVGRLGGGSDSYEDDESGIRRA